MSVEEDTGSYCQDLQRDLGEYAFCKDRKCVFQKRLLDLYRPKEIHSNQDCFSLLMRIIQGKPNTLVSVAGLCSLIVICGYKTFTRLHGCPKRQARRGDMKMLMLIGGLSGRILFFLDSPADLILQNQDLKLRKEKTRPNNTKI